jgi:phosphodiesterase/alkaline phosphatase D-like protein
MGVCTMKRLSILILTTGMILAGGMTASAKQGAKPASKEPAVKITNGPRVEGVGPTWAVIAWTTNTGGSTIVRYGIDSNNLNETAKAPYADNEKTKAQNHRVHLKDLKPNTKYFFVADSGQGEGTGTEAKSPVGEFTTKGHK